MKTDPSPVLWPKWAREEGESGKGSVNVLHPFTGVFNLLKTYLVLVSSYIG